LIGLDTNVLVRYIVGDDVNQERLASDLIENKCTKEKPAHIALIVLCELVWVLSRAYKSQKEEILKVLENILLTENFQIEDHDIAWNALIDFGMSKADYADCIISRINQKNACYSTFSFDKAASDLDQVTLLK
jgi:predicted nucleic-acid-binding protein